MSASYSDYTSELAGFALVAFYGGTLHGALRYIREPVEVGDRYERLGETWEFDGAMFIKLVAVEVMTW